MHIFLKKRHFQDLICKQQKHLRIILLKPDKQREKPFFLDREFLHVFRFNYFDNFLGPLDHHVSFDMRDGLVAGDNNEIFAFLKANTF